MTSLIVSTYLSRWLLPFLTRRAKPPAFENLFAQAALIGRCFRVSRRLRMSNRPVRSLVLPSPLVLTTFSTETHSVSAFAHVTSAVFHAVQGLHLIWLESVPDMFRPHPCLPLASCCMHICRAHIVLLHHVQLAYEHPVF